MASEYALLLEDLAEVQDRRERREQAQLHKSQPAIIRPVPISATHRRPAPAPRPVPPTPAAINAARNAAISGVMAKAMTAFSEGRMTGDEVRLLDVHARLLAAPLVMR